MNIDTATFNEIKTYVKSLELRNAKLSVENTELKKELKGVKRQSEIYRANLIAEINGQNEEIRFLKEILGFKPFKI